MSAIDRRSLLCAAAASSAVGLVPAALRAAATPIDHGRPLPGVRRFSSAAIERTIARVRTALGTANPTAAKLGTMFAQCFPNTLDTTVELGGTAARPDTFVITGDIEAMWLRDSTAQVSPYLPMAREDPRLALLIAGVIKRQTDCILLDPYANAFSRTAVPGPHASDQTDMKPGIFERKWEIDSLCYPIRLSHGYWRTTGNTRPFDERWRQAGQLSVATFRTQQRKNGQGPYRFQRETGWNPDSVPNDGRGNPVRPVGLIASVFRPSDDATVFPFLVPSNIFAVVSLRQLGEMHAALFGDATFAAECRALADEVEQALRLHATVHHPRYGKVWAYEVDGFGGTLFMDDANVPSLLSLPYLGWCGRDDPVYRRTRALVLSEDNPWFYRGKTAEGIGSPHTGARRIWPIAIAMRALTSDDDAEIATALHMLATTDAGSGFLHEAFDGDDARKFSRPWFAWANTLFGELILDVLARRPRLFERL